MSLCPLQNHGSITSCYSINKVLSLLLKSSEQANNSGLFLVRSFAIRLVSAVDLRISSFNLILAMDFMKKLADFMTTGLETEHVKKEEKKEEKKPTFDRMPSIALDQVSILHFKQKSPN